MLDGRHMSPRLGKGHLRADGSRQARAWIVAQVSIELELVCRR